jgi:hypothetical protein
MMVIAHIRKEDLHLIRALPDSVQLVVELAG